MDKYYVVPIVIGPQFQNFTVKCCFLAWRRAAENVDCYPTVATTTTKMFTFLEPAPTGNVFFDIFKSKNEEKFKIVWLFLFSNSKTIWPILGA